MCTNYTPTARDRLRAMRLGLTHLPETDWPPEVFPGYEAPVVVAGDGLDEARCVLARFGLLPRWSRDARHAAEMARHTYNARSETVSEKPSYRSPWRECQFALAPMDNYFEPCWETGRAVRWRIGQAGDEPFAAAGLWEKWTDRASGQVVTSFTLLTVNADGHPLMGRMHRPGDEKRMLAIITPADYAAWLHATPGQALALLHATPAVQLAGEAAPRERRASADLFQQENLNQNGL